jgi:hypothetical protein
MRWRCAFAGATVPYPRIALISFMGYAIGHNVGLNTLSGGAIRYRAYSALGLKAKQIATIIAFGTLTFCWAPGVLLGCRWCRRRACRYRCCTCMRWLAILAGSLLLVAVGAYVAGLQRHAPAEVLAFRDSGAETARRVCADCGRLHRSAVRGQRLYVLLPPQAATLDFAAFAGVYLIAIAAGVISNVPGGIGVFETCCCCCCPLVPKDRLLGALVAVSRHLLFRAIRARAGAAGGARDLGASRARWCVSCGWAHLSHRGDAAGDRDRGVPRRAVLLFSGATPGSAIAWHCCAISCRCRCWSCRICSAARGSGPC